MKGGCVSELYDTTKAAMTVEQQAQHDSEYQSLLALYIALLKSLRTNNREEALFALSELRTEIAFKYVLQGFGIDFEYASNLLMNSKVETLTQYDRDLRDRLKAAIQNLIDFSVCQQYQLYDETVEMMEGEDVDFNSDEYEELLLLCRKYNDTYSAIENADIAYAASIAAKWIRMSASDWVVYWTMNDAKVRPWHMALQGYAAHRDEFPSWMIPPIEYNCRCFLECLEVSAAGTDFKHIRGSAQKIVKPQQLNDVYAESLAKCGRIFGPAHSYFSVRESDKEMLQGFVTRLNTKYYG